MENVKLTTSIEYRIPLSSSFEGAIFTDAGNIWSLRENNLGDQFKFSKFLSQLGVGSGLGIRFKWEYFTFRMDAAYKVHDPNQPEGERWVIKNWHPLQPRLNFAIGYPF